MNIICDLPEPSIKFVISNIVITFASVYFSLEKYILSLKIYILDINSHKLIPHKFIFIQNNKKNKMYKNFFYL